MNLVIDSGNTRIKTGLFDGRKLISTAIYNSKDTERFLKSIARSDAQRIIISDVTQKLNQRMIKNKDCIFLNEKTLLPVKLNYRPLKSLGKDRICNAVAACSLLKGAATLIIDCGTALKMDLVANHTFLGGSIGPGLQMRFESLHRSTAALPLIKPVFKFEPYGQTTRASITCGVQFGMLSEMENRIRLHKKEYRNLKILLTGGDWMWFANQLKYPIFVAPQLTLIGLNEILLFQK
jgi:type III pantothenate kinase